MASSPLRDRRILIVEDEYLIAVSLQDALENAGSVVVGPVPSVDKAIQKMSRSPTLTPRFSTSISEACLPSLSRICSSPGKFRSFLPRAMRTTCFENDIPKLRIAPNHICSRRWKKR
jgi:hypothetical protein